MTEFRGRSIAVAIATSAVLAAWWFGPLARLSYASDAGPVAHGSSAGVLGLTERPRCASDTSAADRSVHSEIDSGQRLLLVVPPTAILDLVDGVVTAATTNTGCAPRPVDTVFGRYSDGTIVELHQWDEDVIWVGDFTQAGVSVAQQP